METKAICRFALIGTGFWGAKLAEAIGRADGVELACCYSRSPEKRAEFAERFGCEAAQSYEAALEAADAVVLATPNEEHEVQAVAAATRGKHVFVEKPIAASSARSTSTTPASRRSSLPRARWA